MGIQVFLGWSGGRSLDVARALRDWLPYVIHNCKPWLSEEDLGEGGFWTEELGSSLQGAGCGILVLTPEGAQSAWLGFEAGALRALGKAVYVLGHDIDVAGSPGPWRHLTAFDTSMDSVRRLVTRLAAELPPDWQAPDTVVRQAFEDRWPSLKAHLDRLPGVATAEPFEEEVLRLLRRVHGHLGAGAGAPIAQLPSSDFARESAVRAPLPGDAPSMQLPAEEMDDFLAEHMAPKNVG